PSTRTRRPRRSRTTLNATSSSRPSRPRNTVSSIRCSLHARTRTEPGRGTGSSGERVRAAAIARARSVSRPTHRMTLLGARVSDVWEAIEVHETRAVELGPSVLAKGCDSGSQCGRSRPAQMQLLWEVPEAGSETHRRTWCLHLR